MNLSDRTDERALDEALAALRQAETRVETPSRVEAAVLAAWDANPPSTVASGVGRTWRYAAAMAAGVVLTVTLGRLGQELRDAEVTLVEPPPTRLLLVGEPILDGEAVRVVRMRLPAATLSNLGMRSTAGHPADAVDVDVIVGEDGVARGIRVGM